MHASGTERVLRRKCQEPAGLHWKVGGVGVWWQNRCISENPMTEAEEHFTHSQMCGNDLSMWTCFNDTQNSSTRCELGAAILGINPPVPAHVGIDNQGVVSIGTQIIDHMEARQNASLNNEEGALRLGGTLSPLQSVSPFKRLWNQFQDGDLWETFHKAVEAKGPRWVRLRKVKGHATDDMVKAGKVQEHEKLGNDKADVNADKGAIEDDKRLHDLADHYSHRQRYYGYFMQRVKKYIIGMRKAEKELRGKIKLRENPLEDPTINKKLIPQRLNYGETRPDQGHEACAQRNSIGDRRPASHGHFVHRGLQ